MQYDLLIQGGHVIDPASGTDAALDVGVADGRIVAIGANLSAGDAATVVDAGGAGRYVVPGLLDIHTHVAFGATTAGVGMACCAPDEVGIESGVTTLLDAGSVGVANFGTFPAYILPQSATRVLCYLNIGSHAHSMPDPSDVTRLEDVDPDVIAACLDANPGTIVGLKLRLVGPVVAEHGETIITSLKSIAATHGLPVMVHIGDSKANERGTPPERMLQLTQFLLSSLERGDILTHLCTPNPGGVGVALEANMDALLDARSRGVVLDAALGKGNFGFDVAGKMREAGLAPDTISSDITGMGQTFQSLMECMAKFLAVGYSVHDVIAMTTSQAAMAIGHADDLGALAVGREADITIMEVVDGEFSFVDTIGHRFDGAQGIVPVQTVRGGRLYAPRWGTHPWGWLPESRSAIA